MSMMLVVVDREEQSITHAVVEACSPQRRPPLIIICPNRRPSNEVKLCIQNNTVAGGIWRDGDTWEYQHWALFMSHILFFCFNLIN